MADVLIVDDDEEYGELVRERLASSSITAEFQHGPFGTLNRIRRDRPKVLILDVNMPAISGQAVTQLLRSTPGLDIRIMLLSSMDGAALERVCADVGADLALSKSASRHELVAAVQQLLQLAQRT